MNLLRDDLHMKINAQATTQYRLHATGCASMTPLGPSPEGTRHHAHVITHSSVAAVASAAPIAPFPYRRSVRSDG